MKRIVFFGGPESDGIADYFSIVLNPENITKVDGEDSLNQLENALVSSTPLIFVYSEYTESDYSKAEELIRTQDPNNIIHLISTEKHNIPLDTTILLYVWHNVKAVDVENIAKHIYR